MINTAKFHHELKKLNVDTRNKVRAICSSSDKVAVKVFNRLRKNLNSKELFQVEMTLSLYNDRGKIIPEHFPTQPQTHENFIRLCSLPLKNYLQHINHLTKHYEEKLLIFFKQIEELNSHIIKQDFSSSERLISEIFQNYGYSHFLLRKCVLIKQLSQDDTSLKGVYNLIDLSGGAKKNNLIVNSLLHCFQEEQDYLSLKKSIMGLRDNGDANKFRRDLTRLPFHPHAKNAEELSQLVQSNLQSSLIDAIIITKINTNLFESSDYPHLFKINGKLNETSPDINSIASTVFPFEDPEEVFFKQSSAWYESDEILEYRTLPDYFYDSPDSSYIEYTDTLIQKLSNRIGCNNLPDLVSTDKLTSHHFQQLHEIEANGTITRSSILNFLLYTKEGNLFITELDLFTLMTKTSDLARTINIQKAKTLAAMLPSDLSKLVIYLLIAKKSSNERDRFSLRRTLQRILINDYQSELLSLVEYLAENYLPIADFIYAVSNEAFLAQLSHIVKSPKQMIEIRAELHNWKGLQTGEQYYINRARSLLIDHQISIVRGEIDDHRIYVDITRFSEWVYDNMAHELNAVLTMMKNNNELEQKDNPQIYALVEKCFYEFCTNSFFGIASYLGRRIRHGTFRGHLYSSVIKIEKRHQKLLQDPVMSSRWESWKNQYEEKVQNIINNKLHVKSNIMPDGFLIPNTAGLEKNEIIAACVHGLVEDFTAQGHTHNSSQLISEYCWRLAEVDLRSINSYFKGQKTSLLDFSELSSITFDHDEEIVCAGKDFTRELHSIISDKITSISSWFKRPHSVSPKISLGYLYKAVVSEVQQTFEQFSPDTTFEENKDIELIGGAHHVLYDALYVIVYNAAKHGKQNGKVTYDYFIVHDKDSSPILKVIIDSEIKDSETELYISDRLKVSPTGNIEDAQVFENRSGIKKLYHLQKYDDKFKINKIACENRFVKIEFTYSLEY